MCSGATLSGPLGALATALLTTASAAATAVRPKDGPTGGETSCGSGGGGGGEEVHLFNDQYIVKPPSSAHARFPWHRDSQWWGAAARLIVSTRETFGKENPSEATR